MKRVSRGAARGLAAVLAAILAGCTTTPAAYMATLPASDSKWNTPECETARQAAATYEDKNLNLGLALALGPYGLAIAAATRENSEKQRRRLAREVHLRCSSQPLPPELEAGAAA